MLIRGFYSRGFRLQKEVDSNNIEKRGTMALGKFALVADSKSASGSVSPLRGPTRTKTE